MASIKFPGILFLNSGVPPTFPLVFKTIKLKGWRDLIAKVANSLKVAHPLTEPLPTFLAAVLAEIDSERTCNNVKIRRSEAL